MKRIDHCANERDTILASSRSIDGNSAFELDSDFIASCNLSAHLVCLELQAISKITIYKSCERNVKFKNNNENHKRCQCNLS